MADERRLLHPLRGDQLKPRASTQAVWNPHASPVQLAPAAAAAPEPDLQPAMLASETGVPPANPAPEPTPEALMEICLGDAELPAANPDEGDEDYADEDAVPTDSMPAPVFVPVYGMEADVQRHACGWRWLWLLLIPVLLAAGVIIWHFGLPN